MHRKPVKQRRATLADVAALAGVSMMTVSNVVNGKWKTTTQETRRRVEEAIVKLDYRPAAHARNLRLDRSFSIGMVVLDENPAFLTDTFITNLVAGLTNQLSDNGYSLLLQGINPHQFEESNLLARIQTDALCVLSSGPAQAKRRFFERIQSLNQPLAIVQEQGWQLGDACMIRQDDHAGGAAIASHLMEQGARNLVMIVPRTEWPAMTERVRGVRDTLAGAGLDTRLLLVTCADEGHAATQQALAEVLANARKIDAVIGGNDQIAVSAMHLLKHRGLRIPDDVMVTGFNAFDAWRYSEPTLTTVHSPAYEMGQCAGRTLIDRLMTGRFETGDIVFPVEMRPAASSLRKPEAQPPRAAAAREPPADRP